MARARREMSSSTSLVADPAAAERMGVMGRKRAVEEFSWPSIAARTVELYQSLTRSR